MGLAVAAVSAWTLPRYDMFVFSPKNALGFVFLLLYRCVCVCVCVCVRASCSLLGPSILSGASLPVLHAGSHGIHEEATTLTSMVATGETDQPRNEAVSTRTQKITARDGRFILIRAARSVKKRKKGLGAQRKIDACQGRQRARANALELIELPRSFLVLGRFFSSLHGLPAPVSSL